MHGITRLISSLGWPGVSDSARHFSHMASGSTARKSYLSVADRLVVSGTNFLTMVIVGRVCGMEALGVFALAWTLIIGMIVVSEAVILSPLTVFMGEYAKKAQEKAYCGAVLSLQVTLCALTAVILAFGLWLTSLWPVDPVILSAGVALVFALPAAGLREFVRRYNFAHMNAAAVFLLDVIVTFIQLAGLAILWGAGMLTPASAILCIAVANSLPSLIWFFHNLQRFRRDAQIGILQVAAQHWIFGRWICCSQLSDLAATHGVTWVIAALAGTAAAGLFAACNSIIMLVNPLLFGIGSILLPRASLAFHEHGLPEVRRIVWKATMIFALTVGAICAGITLGGELIVQSLYSFDDLNEIQILIFLLALAQFLSGSMFAVDSGLMVIKRPDINFKASLLGLLITLGIAVALTPPYGVAGTAFAMVVGNFVGSLMQSAAFIRLVGGPQFSIASENNN